MTGKRKSKKTLDSMERGIKYIKNLKKSTEEGALVDWRTAFGDLIDKFTEAGVALKGFRLREGWTQAEFSDKIGINQANLSKMERGKRAIRKHMAKKLASIFGTDYCVFYLPIWSRQNIKEI